MNALIVKVGLVAFLGVLLGCLAVAFVLLLWKKVDLLQDTVAALRAALERRREDNRGRHLEPWDITPREVSRQDTPGRPARYVTPIDETDPRGTKAPKKR